MEQPRSIPASGHGHPGVHVEKVRHDDDGIAQAGGITPTALFPVTAALTDDGGRPPDPRANEGPVPGAPAWDGRLSESSSCLASIVAHRKGNSSAHDSSINAAASASPSPGQLNQPVPLGSWLYLGSAGWEAGNGLPFPNPPPRTPLASLAPTGRMWWPGMDCPQGIVPCRLFPLASAVSRFPRCRGLLRLGRFRRRRYLAMYLYIPVCEP